MYIKLSICQCQRVSENKLTLRHISASLAIELTVGCLAWTEYFLSRHGKVDSVWLLAFTKLEREREIVGKLMSFLDKMHIHSNSN